MEEVRKDPSLEASEDAWAYEHLDFRLLAPQTVRINVYRFKPPNVWSFVTAVLGI